MKTHFPIIPDRMIRLISILPESSHSIEDVPIIACKVSPVMLDIAPPYVALSYTWGDAHDPLPILVNGSVVMISRNLHSALTNLRDEFSKRPLWVDAVCIDQSNNNEKSQQVQLMRRIYQQALHVTVWLGPSNKSSDSVMDYLTKLGTEALACGVEGLSGEFERIWRALAAKPQDYRDTGISPDGGELVYTVKQNSKPGEECEVRLGSIHRLFYNISDRHDASLLFPVADMADFFSRGWWSRIWVVQEFVLAKAVAFACGKKKLSRRTCAAALSTFRTLRTVVMDSVTSDNRQLTDYEVAIAQASFDPRPQIMFGIKLTFTLREYTLMSLLRQTCVEENESFAHRLHSMNASNPKDKIYGILGLASDREVLKIVPNYGQTCAEIYADVSMKLMVHGYPSILSLCQFPKAMTGLPSWVPDWSVPFKMQLQHTMIAHKPVLSPRYLASGVSAASFQFSITVDKKLVLSLTGLVVDTVHATGKTFSDIASESRSGVAWVKEWTHVLLDLSRLRDGAYGGDEERFAAVFRTSTADFTVGDGGQWERSGPEGVLPFTLIHWFGVDGAVLQKNGVLDLLKKEGLPPKVDGDVLAKTGGLRYMGDVGLRARGRKPFVTSKGNLGLGPLGLKEGDAVAIFLGIQVPFIIREAGKDMYQLIGETYLDEYMDGEAFEGKPETRKIHLL